MSGAGGQGPLPAPPPSDGSVLARLHPEQAEILPVLLRDLESDAPSRAHVDGAQKPGERQGRYRVLGEIARGGVGVVLKGYDVDLGRNVAMKVIREEFEDIPEIVQRFVEEAQIGGQLQHPGIVPVYEIGLGQDRRPYFTMKLVKGQTFAALLAARADRAKERHRDLTIFASVCQTMAYAHARGVIHRDLKPSNVMVGAFGEVLVLDWGMGKVLREGGVEDERRAAARADETFVATLRSAGEGSQSLVGSVLGTPCYMPPEQARGSTDLMDERSDVFALGGMLTEILTGEPTYRGAGAEILRQAARGAVEDAVQRLSASGADPELVALAQQCLAPAREARPRSAAEVAEVVVRYLGAVDGRAQAARLEAAAAHGRAEQERRARRLTALLAGVVLVGALGAGATWWTLDQRRRERRDRAATQVSEALAQAREHESARRWPQALAAAAQALEGSREAPEDLRVRAAAAHAEIRRGSDAAAAAERLRDSNRALLVALDAARATEGDDRYPADWAASDRKFKAAFGEQGLEPDLGTPLEASARLAARGIPAELAAALDSWALARRRLEDEDGHARLAQVADLFDADEQRVRIRRAVAAVDAEGLRRLADAEGVDGLPVETLRLLGGALREVGAYSDAVTLLERAHRRHPQDDVLCLQRARALHEAGRWDESVRYFVAALALAPEAPVVYAEAGQELINVGEHARAEQVFRDALERWPGDGVMRAQLASALMLQARPDEADAESARALELAPRNPWVRTSRAVLLVTRGRNEEARALADEALALAPAAGEICAHASSIYSWTERHDRGLELAQRGAALKPHSAWTQVRLAEAMAAVGRQVEAIAAAREAVRQGPLHAGAHRVLGNMLGALRMMDESIRALTTAATINPRDAGVWIDLTHAHRLRGEYGQARRCLDRVRELVGQDSNWGVGLLHLGAEVTSLAAAEPRLVAILEGYLEPAHIQERINAALLGCLREYPHAAFRQMRAAYAESPAKLRDPLELEALYAGACAAARVAAGEGDAARASEAERLAAAEQGRAWLREALDLRKADQTPDQVCRILEIWLHCPALAGLRDAEAVARLPTDLQGSLRELWEAVHAALAQARRGSRR